MEAWMKGEGGRREIGRSEEGRRGEEREGRNGWINGRVSK